MTTAVDRPKRNRNVICASSKACDTSTSLLESMNSDYGFAPSWPAIPPPSLLPQGRVMEASTVVEGDQKHTLGKSKQADSNSDNDMNTSETGSCAMSRPHSPDATFVTASQQQQRLQSAPAAQSMVLGLAQGHGEQHLKQHHQEQKRQNEEEINAHHPQHYYRREGEHKEQQQMTSDGCVGFAECLGKSKTAASTSGSCAAAASSDTMSSPTLETAKGSGAIVSPPPSPQREQVSLPEDIYGAARVSEYWHGVHALSSLASSYVYDDIWAGDGGLNPREDIMGIAEWAASDPAGGEGVGVEASKGEGASSAREAHSLHPGSTVGLDRGNELPRHRSGCQRRRRKLPQFGCDREGGCAEENGERSTIHVEIPEGVYDAAAWDEEIDLGNSRKRRTPSPGSGREREAGYCSSSVAAAASGSTTSQWSSVPNYSRGGGGFGGEGRGGAPTLSLRESCKREVSSPQLSCCGSTSGASSGEDESFFAGRVLDPAPRPPRSSAFRRGGDREGSKPDLSVDHPRGGGGSVGDDRAGAGAADDGSGRRRLAEGDGSVSWPPEAAIAAAVVAGPLHLSASDQRKASHIEKEAFFSRHALEPSPRLDWHREAIEESQTGNATAPHTVAKGIVVHRLTQGIGAPSESARSSTTENGCASSPESRGSPPLMQFPDRIGGSFRTAADARAWSRDSGKEVKERGKRESSREDSGGVAVSNNGVGGNCTGGDWEWQVQPEAMSAYFTNVIGLTPPDASNLYRSRSPPFGSSESLGRISGVCGADTPGSMTEVYQDLGAAAGDDEGVSKPDAASGALDSCSTSCLAEAESGSDGDNSWGW